MAQNLIDLRRRIRAVKDTQKTTQAMKTVSAVKMRRSVNELNRICPIMEKIESLLKHVAQASGKEVKSHPFLKERETGDTVIVAISADKGLCGAFNSHLIEKVENHYLEQLDQEGDNLSLVTLGNKAFKHFKKKDYPIKKNYQSVISRLKYHHALDLSKYLQEIFLNPDEEIKRVEFVFTRYISASSTRPLSGGSFPSHLHGKRKKRVTAIKKILNIYLSRQPGKFSKPCCPGISIPWYTRPFFNPRLPSMRRGWPPWKQPHKTLTI